MIKQYWLHFVLGLVAYTIGYWCGRKDRREIVVKTMQISGEQAEELIKVLGALDEADNSTRAENKEE